MTTEKQKQASRNNAKHSTGPKTDEGKQRSSQNTLKHGLYAVESVIPGEDPAEFDDLCHEFGERYLPDGPYERSLVRQMADAEWRLRRITRLEADFLKAAVESQREKHNRLHPGEPEPDESLLRGRALQTRTVELTRFERYAAALSRRQRQAHQALIECRKQENQQYAATDTVTHRPPIARDPARPPAPDPSWQHDDIFQERTRGRPSRFKSTTSDPPGQAPSDESAA